MILDLVFNVIDPNGKFFDVGFNVAHLCVVALQQDSDLSNRNVDLIQVLA